MLKNRSQSVPPAVDNGLQWGSASDISISQADILVNIKHAQKSKDDTVENLGKKLNPYLNATGVVSILMTIFMIIVIVTK